MIFSDIADMEELSQCIDVKGVILKVSSDETSKGLVVNLIVADKKKSGLQISLWNPEAHQVSKLECEKMFYGCRITC